MKTGKKLWSLLLALVMVVSLLGGAFVASAADSVTVTPDATYGGAVLNMTATKVDDQITVFDLASIGFGTGIEYAFWFEADGTFCFDQDVTLNYQGAVKAELKAGEVTGIAGYSECYLTLDDGNMIALIDKANPGNFASLAADTAFDGFPGTVSAGAAAAEEPAEEAPAEEPAEEEPAAEEPAEEAPAAEGEGFVKAASLDAGKQYLIVTEYEGKYYALTSTGVNSKVGAVEVAVDGDTVAAADAAAVWIPDGSDHLENVGNPGQFVFASSGGLYTWDSSMLRTFVYDAASETVILHSGKYTLSFDGAAFGQAEAAKILLFVGEGAAAAEPAEAEPEEEIVFPAPETVYRDAVKNEDGSITLAFTSDVHYRDGDNMNLKTWLDNSGVGYIDAIGFCGDMGSAYASNAEDFWTWTGSVMNYVDSMIAEGKVGDAIYTLGNHEWFPSAGGDYLHTYADYEAAQRLRQVGEGLVTDDYIIYCFGAGSCVSTQYKNDYMEEDIAKLDEWLATAPTDTPIFILTHFPLHFWYNTRYAPHAVDVIDVLNKYSDDHEIIFFWGHNHSDYDDSYYTPKFPGDEIRVDEAGNTRTLNFYYMGAGCTSDAEYTGPGKGSASIFNKGLIVTINADKTLDFTYYTLEGQKMYVESPWLVRFRTGYGDYETVSSVYVDDGETVTPPEAPELEGYEFTGWVYWNDYKEVPFDFTAPVHQSYLITAKYVKILTPAAAPDAADCVTVTPNSTYNGSSLTMTAAGVGDLFTAFDLASIGYGTGIEYGFWFDGDGVISFDQDATLYYQGSVTDFTLKAGEFYNVEGFGEHYLKLDDGNMLLLLEKAAPGNFANLPGDQPFSAFPGTIAAGSAEEAEPEPAPVEPEPAPVEPEPAPAPVGQTYTVQAGDTLWSIARRFYGSGFKWDVIYNANYDVIKNPRMIYVGQVLLIP